GENAECHVISHAVSCSCLAEFVGDPFVQCIVKTEPIKPCEPSPCGANAQCRERNGAGACICLPDYQGNPYEGCRPECVLSSDCQPNKACIRNKCADPCPGTCGENAECSVINHVPACSCRAGSTGDAFRLCSPLPVEASTEEPSNPCAPSPCGPNSQCRVVNGQGVCSCLPEYQGAPPSCKPECVVSSECPSNRACHRFKCANPCVGTCGVGARCEVINHNPICSCPTGLTGDPFARCYEQPPEPSPRPAANPCVPSPCGLNSECRDIGGQPSCSCRASYMGVPPNCRPECVVNTDCPSHLACITEKCKDPCLGSCGFNAECRVQNHIPICTCAEGFVGNAF
uniref:EGF-like domain-containing protein n=2 Tax=Dendroctonus ponderosae TaxID=77166 RepID=A0AAR5QG30_DENPD